MNIPEGTEQVANTYEQQTAAAIPACRALKTPETQEQAQALTDYARQMRDFRLKIQAKRDGIVKPIKASVKLLDEMFKPAIANCKEIEAICKGLVLTHKIHEDEKVRKQLAEATSAAEVKQAAEALVVPVKGMKERTTWSWEVTDEAAIPDEFWIRTLDTRRLNSLAVAERDKLSIPGIKPVAKKSMSF